MITLQYTVLNYLYSAIYFFFEYPFDAMSDVPGSSSIELMNCKFGLICGRDFVLAYDFERLGVKLV